MAESSKKKVQADRQRSILDKIFRDKDGDIVIWQSPNIPLYGWIVFKLLSVVFHGSLLKTDFGQLGNAFLFIWSYLEAKEGVNYFRKLLGLAILASIAISFFR